MVLLKLIFNSDFVLAKDLNGSFYLNSDKEEKPQATYYPLTAKGIISSHKIFSNEDEPIFPRIFIAGIPVAFKHFL